MSANPPDLFEQAFSWFQEHYAGFRFFTERDIVWTVQNRLIDLISTAKVESRVYNDYPMLPGQRADIAIVENGIVDVAVEFKYEPSHMRSGVDILSSK
ncbi:MAG TPA: hypothetical protein VIC60_00190, partial [Thermomicrobiales bacterium]